MAVAMSFFAELKRRNVFRVGAAYVVAAWLIIQVVETIFPAFDFSDAAVRIVVIVLSIGLVPVVILAWAFELTPEGLKLDKDVSRGQSISARTGKKLDRIIMVVLALALGYFAFDKFVLDPARDAEELATATQEARQEGRSEALVESYGDKSIAVLPFVNMSDDAGNEYFSDGISEELLNLLAKIPELRVISRSSAFFFKGKDIKITDVARELNVVHILEGSVRKAGNQVRITAQLIDAHSDTHLWSETYDRELDDIFAIQDEIAAAVVDALKLTLLGEVPQAEQIDPEAYALYLQARYLDAQGTAESIMKSNAMLKQVLAMAPNYARAWRILGRNYVNQQSELLLPRDEAYTLAREALNQALTINPNFAEAHSSLGWIAMEYDRDLAAAAQHFEYGLSLEPANLVVLGNSTLLLGVLGRLDEQIAIKEYGVARDPLNPIDHHNLAVAYYLAERPDNVIATVGTLLMLNPDRPRAHFFLSMALLAKGENEAALKAIQQEPSEFYRLRGLVMTYHALGQAAESDAALAEFMIEKYQQTRAYAIAGLLAYRGEADRSFKWLGKAAQHKYSYIIVNEPMFANIHDDPRWLPFLESIGRSPEQLAAFEFNVTLPE